MLTSIEFLPTGLTQLDVHTFDDVGGFPKIGLRRAIAQWVVGASF